MSEIVNSQVKDQPIDRVFVGVPDVFTTEQYARLHGLVTADKIGVRFTAKNDGADPVAETIAAAERFAKYLLTGASA